MKRVANVFTGAALAAAFLLSGSGGAAAQAKPAQAPKPMHPTAKPATGAPQSKDAERFRGIASKLGTTPDALESAYQTAKQGNPKLTRGQFVAANMLAHNLSEKYPTITTQAILDGLKSGKSLGQILQGYGLSAKDAREAERQADRDAKAAQREAQQPAPKNP